MNDLSRFMRLPLRAGLTLKSLQGEGRGDQVVGGEGELEVAEWGHWSVSGMGFL